MPPADNWECCHCHNVWSYVLYAGCVACQHMNCSRCTPLRKPKSRPSHPPYRAATRSRPDPSRRAPRYGLDGPKSWRKNEQGKHEPDLTPPIQPNVMHSRPRSVEKGTLPEDIGISKSKPLGTSDITGPTPNRDNQCANFTSSPGGKQVKSVTSPIKMAPGAPAAALLHSNESDHVIQNSSSCANESLSGVKSDSSVIANAATLVDNDLMSRLELLRVNSRRHSKSSDSNSESHVKAITTSHETGHLEPPTLPKQLSRSSVLSKGTARSSTKIKQSLGYEGVEILEPAASGTKHPSTIRVTDTKSDKAQQEEGIPEFSKLFNVQLFEDHYQRFMRGYQDGAEELDGDDAGSHNSSSEQDTSVKELLTSDSHSTKPNRKHRIDETSKGQATDSDDENTRRRPPKRPRKTAEEKQTELRCIEFAAGRQTTAKCLSYSTRNLHRLKSDHLIVDHLIAKSELDIGRRQLGETEALLWKRLFMKRNPEWLDSHSAIPSPYYSANYEPIQQFELYLRQQADRLRLPDSQSRNNEDIPDISGQDQVDYLPTRHFGEASDRPLGNIALSNTRPQLGQSDHPQYAADVGNGPASPTRALLDTTVQNSQVFGGGTADAFFSWTDQSNLPSSQVSSTMSSLVDTSSSSHNSPSGDPMRDKICRCKTHTDTCDRSQFASGAEKCVSCQGYFSWTANAMSYIALTTEGGSLCRCKWHDRACRKLQEEYDARKCASCKGWLAFSEQANKLIKMASGKRTTEPCEDQAEYSEFSELINFA